MDGSVLGSRGAAIGYVSTGGATGFGGADMQQQAAALEAFCARRGWRLVAQVHERRREGRRGAPRPALEYALGRLTAGDASCLLVCELGHLCSSVIDLGRLLARLDAEDARLVVLEPALDTGTELGRATARLVMTVGEWERAERLERSRHGLTVAREKGAVQPVMSRELKRRIARMRAAGMTLQAIVDELNEAGVPTVRGGARWRPSSVQAAVGYRRPARLGP